MSKKNAKDKRTNFPFIFIGSDSDEEWRPFKKGKNETVCGKMGQLHLKETIIPRLS